MADVATWLPTHYRGAWTQILARPPQTGDMVRAILAQLPASASSA